MKENAHQIRDVPIIELLKNSECTVRLFNAINRAKDQGWWRFETVRDYLEAGESGYRTLIGLPNLGRRTAVEFVELISNALNDEAFACSIVDGFKDSTRLENSQIGKDYSQIASVSIMDLIGRYTCSVRLSNAMQAVVDTPKWKYSTVGDYLAAGHQGLLDLYKVPNLGKKTAIEFQNLIDRFIQESNLPSEHIEHTGVDVLDNLQNRIVHSYSAEDRLAKILDSLNPRERTILNRRLGLEGGRVETLEEISADFDLTRERIRQIESKVRRKISHKQNQKVLEELRESALHAFWQSTPHRIVSVEDGKRLLSQLDEQYQVAIWACFSKPTEWFDKHFLKYRGKLLEPRVSKYELSNLVREIESELSQLKLPVRLSQLAADDRDLGQVRAALEILDGTHVYGDLVFCHGGPKKSRRAARLLSLIDNSKSPFGEHTLETWYNYREQNPDDPCSPRDLEIIYAMHPHLFVSTGFHIWTSIKNLKREKFESQSTNVMHAFPSVVSESKFLELVSTYMQRATGIRSIIYGLMDKHGPMSLSNLIGREITTKGSTTGIIGSDPIFLRFAPGIFGLPKHIDRVDDKVTMGSELLNYEQCKCYVLNRYADEPANTYHLWTPSYEKALVSWAHENEHRDLYKSLLYVLRNEGWSEGVEKKKILTNKILKSASWCMNKEPDYRLEFVPFDLKSFFMILQLCKGRDRVSWTSINRSLGFRIDSRLSVWALMMLIAIGVVSTEDNWLRSHRVIGRLQDWDARANTELSDKGKLSWNSDLGRDLLSMLRTGEGNLTGSWVDRDQLIALITTIVECDENQNSNYAKTADGVDEDEMEFPNMVKSGVEEHDEDSDELLEMLGVF